MKIFSLILVTLLTFADNRSSFLLTINQNVELTNQVTTIILEFEGELEVIETIGNKISIETQLISAHKSVLQYKENKQQFKIVPVFQDYGNKEKMVLKPKKINTSIFVKGQKHEAVKKYKIAIPAHIQIVRQ